jgi:hypothetical protein
MMVLGRISNGAVAMTLALTATIAQAQQSRAELREQIDSQIFRESLRDCQPNSMARCWYMVFGTGDTPVRKIWFVDLKPRYPSGPSADLVEIDVVEAHESDDPKTAGANDFLFYKMQYQCRGKKVRVLDGYAYMFGDRVDRAPGASQWLTGYKKSWYGEVEKAACDKKVQLSPTAKDMLWIGDYYRPVDLVDFTRRYLWEQK